MQNGRLVVREARSQKSTTDLLSHFSKHGVDAWTAITHLAKTQHGGVRDYLINRMYELCSEDVDVFLPQLWYNPDHHHHRHRHRNPNTFGIAISVSKAIAIIPLSITIAIATIIIFSFALFSVCWSSIGR